MVSQLIGLDIFREHFSAFTNEYVVIGGAACSILMSAEDMDFRTTKDIDMDVKEAMQMLRDVYLG